MSLFKKLFKDIFPQQQKWRDEQISVEQPIGRDLLENKKILLGIFGSTTDFYYQPIKLVNKSGFLFYFKSMVDEKEVNERILKNFTQINQSEKVIISDDDLEKVREEYFAGLPFQFVKDYKSLSGKLLNGYVALLIDRFDRALVIAVNSIEYRAITEPSTQTIIRGPKDSFTESIDTNISLIRRKIKNPKLQFEEHVVGIDSRTKISMAYMEGVVNQGILMEARSRIQSINLYAIFDSGNIEEVITDKNYTPFPLIFNTERPDVAAGGILEGRIAIIVEGSPFVLIIPAVLTDFFQSAEDYYQPYLMSSFIRIIRYMAFMVSLLLPGLYVSIISFHHELLPTDLLISIQAQREGVPFPAVFEIFLMEMTFEILREAGIRMPRAVGQTVSIVGALVIGQAAVEAGLVSNALVIVVAFTAIASFVSPIYNFSISTRLLRFVLILFAAVMGLYGILIFLIAMVAHLVSLRSFGVPYLAPVAPLIMEDQQDVFVRFPVWSNKTRPTFLKTEQNIKMNEIHKPGPPKKEGNS
ncbi:spore germination protein [Bacillus sp. CGMCC 1.16607]|uniref:spore germination protein n=1 Tax=Bacillus sp. CGMCC 1.16607 TaxID=3351842 RepID=UPI0036296628